MEPAQIGGYLNVSCRRPTTYNSVPCLYRHDFVAQERLTFMTYRFTTSVFRSAVALAALGAAHTLFAAAPASSNDPSASPSIFKMSTSVADPTRDVRYQPEGVSSSVDLEEAFTPASSLDEERASLTEGYDAGQPSPGRRSYGRSRYQDRLHNADGSSKIAFVAGAGLNVAAGNTAKYYTSSYAFGVGAGINFNKMFGILGEFHYDHLGLTGGAINYQYNNYLTYSTLTSSDLSGLDANAHVISLTANPIINFTGAGRDSKLGAYVTGGVGYYHKVTNFTLPTEEVTYYYSYITNATFDQYTANAFGVNGGAGLTYKLGQFSSERLFLEARYNWLKINSANNTDFFPFNRRNSEYIPVMAGIRF